MRPRSRNDRRRTPEVSYIRYAAIGASGLPPEALHKALRGLLGPAPVAAPDSEEDAAPGEFVGELLTLDNGEVWLEFDASEMADEGCSLAIELATRLERPLRAWFTKVPESFDPAKLKERQYEESIYGAERVAAEISEAGIVKRNAPLTPALPDDGEPMRPRGDASETARAALIDAYKGERKVLGQESLHGVLRISSAKPEGELNPRLLSVFESVQTAKEWRVEQAPSLRPDGVALHILGTDGSKRMTVLGEPEWQELSAALERAGVNPSVAE